MFCINFESTQSIKVIIKKLVNIAVPPSLIKAMGTHVIKKKPVDPNIIRTDSINIEYVKPATSPFSNF